MTVLVTGAAGFIGSTTAHKLLDRGDHVIGIDNLNDYYDVNLKLARLNRLQTRDGFDFARIDIADASAVREVLEQHRPTRIVHLAAQAGVRSPERQTCAPSSPRQTSRPQSAAISTSW